MLSLFAVQAATYQIPAPEMPWLAPTLALLGLGIQIAGYLLKKPLWLCLGLCLVLPGSWQDRDPTLAVGNILAFAALLLCLKK